ncbi:MAG: hypothetical protein GY809_32860 [Planctomycetes bacterium]|nr:hypothetical protein [Planctomycetota bacterium]
MNPLQRIGLGTLVLLAMLTHTNSPAQGAVQTRQLQGHAATRSGLEMQYESAHPKVTTALITRANAEFDPIEWETEPIPAGCTDQFVTFGWFFGMDNQPTARVHHLWVNGVKCLTFETPVGSRDMVWQWEGTNGIVLKLQATLLDRHSDYMGIASLKLPTRMCRPGKPVALKIGMDPVDSAAWFMTFVGKIEKDMIVEAQEVLLKRGDQAIRPVQLTLFSPTHTGPVQVAIVGHAHMEVDLAMGINSVAFELPEVNEATEFTIQATTGNRIWMKKTLTLEPVRKWTIHLVQHTHTDIGYTRPQTDILPDHLRFIDYALDYCDQTDHHPDEAKFRWTCESAWAVKEYLKRRPPQQIDRLRRRVLEGRIELAGMFFNMSEIIDEASLVDQLEPIRQFRKRGFPVQMAMQNDVNGAGWCLVDYFSQIGIKYMIMGEHGHRALLPFDKPTVFWWESPAGNRMMAFRAEHYMTGNFFGVHTGRVETVVPKLSSFLRDLAAKHYPFDHIGIQYSGYTTDNSPPALSGCELIKRWNEIYAWPRLRSAIASDFMEIVERDHADELPVYRAAWPDWWTDGFGSAARETAASRTTHAEMLATKTLLAMAALQGAKASSQVHDDIASIQEALAFYDEHTFGAAESISDPTNENSMVQWAEKSAYAWEAVKKSGMLREEAMGMMQTVLTQADVPTLTVFNTLNWTRSGLCKVYIFNEILPPEKAVRVVDEAGAEIPVQPMHRRSDGTHWGFWVEDVPALGHKTYRLEIGEGTRRDVTRRPFEGVFENDFYRLQLDAATGAVTSLYDKDLKRDLVDQNCAWQLGQFIYERLQSRARMNQKQSVKAPRRTSLTDVVMGDIVEGPVWQSLHVKGQSLECAEDKGVTLEIRLYHREKRVAFHFGMRKLPVTSPEAVYVAFPVDLANGELLFEAQGGMVRPGKDQLEGTASDWNTIQNFAVVRNAQAQVVLGSPEIPLVHFGNINVGKYQYISQPEHAHIYSWVLNNYWVTNFQASQQGQLKWSYYLTSSKDNSNTFAARFGWGSRVPFLSRVLPAGRGGTSRPKRARVAVDIPNVILVTARPAIGGDGIILHLREVEGQPASMASRDLIKGLDPVSLDEVNVLEERIRTIASAITFKPYEVKFLRVLFE